MCALPKMSPYSTIVYLCYLLIFILFYQLSEAASNESFTASRLTHTPPIPVAKSSPSRESSRQRAVDTCETSFSWFCLRLEFVKLIEYYGELEEVQLAPGVTVVKDNNATALTNAEMMADIARSYPQDPSSRLNGLIISKLKRLLTTRLVRFKLIDDTTVADARSAIATSRKHKYVKKGGIEAIIAAGLMMKGMLLAMGMGAIALIAGKALLAALVALTLAAAAGVKGLGGGGKSTTYEIIQKPVYTSSHSHSISHEDGHAYSGHYGSGHGVSGYGSYARSLHPHTLHSTKSQ